MVNQNGYKVPEKAKALFDKYTAGGGCYFIANKINLKNKHADVLKFIENVNLKRRRSGKNYREVAARDVLFYAMFTRDSDRGKNPLLDLIIYRMVYGRPFEQGGLVLNLSKEDYQRLQQKFMPLIKTPIVTSQNPNLDLMRAELKEVVEAESKEFGPLINGPLKLKFEGMLKDWEELGRGVATPLKIEFYPSQPYYPLEISSLGYGNSMIDVYVISNSLVYDTNGMLNEPESKEINTALHNELSRYLDINAAKYVTRFSYNGELKKLTSDAVFKVTDYKGQLENIQRQLQKVQKELARSKRENLALERNLMLFNRVAYNRVTPDTTQRRPVGAPSKSPIGWWKFSEGRGTTARDSSGKNSPGTLVNNPKWIKGKRGGALSFDGISTYVDLPNAPNVNNSSLTITAWAQRNGSGRGADNIIFYQGANTDDKQLGLGFCGGGVACCFFGYDDLHTTSAYTDTDWHHWACTYDAGTKRRILYQDGILQASDIAKGNYQNQGEAYIGARLDNGSYFSGAIGKVRIYNRALSESEIKALQ